MKTSRVSLALLAALAIGVAGAASAHDLRGAAPHVHGHVNKRPHSHPNARVEVRQVRIICYRGPLRVTAWDHPEGPFIEDLIGIGYDYTQAWSIGERVCKDSGGVGNPDLLREVLRNAIGQNPPDHVPVRQR